MTPSLNADYGFTLLGQLHDRVGDVARLEDAQMGNGNGNGVWSALEDRTSNANSADRFSADERTSLAPFGKDSTLSPAEREAACMRVSP